MTIKYELWDSNQLPAYQACAAAFEKTNANIKVDVQQLGWDDYWQGITDGFVSGSGPDVFTDHLARYPEFAQTDQILALNDFVERDKVDTGQYFPGLADLWTTPDGKRFGLPKDWDTIAFTYNQQLLADAGIDAASLGKLDWNPKDGGSFEKLVAHLTTDEAGKRGDEAGFDKTKVKVYGYGFVGDGGANGQTEWSFFTGSNGWTYMDKPFWGTKYNYDDPKFVETIAWVQSLIEKGYAPTLEQIKTSGHMDFFKAKSSALTSLGSWEIGDAVKAEFKVGFFPTPIGPTGKRASMFNGLADSISKNTKHPEESWQWVKFLASADCQNLVADTKVVFPAIPAAAAKVKAGRLADGVDVSAFTIHVEDGTTFTFPIADHASDVNAVMTPAMQAIFTGQGAAADVLKKANADVNAIFG